MKSLITNLKIVGIACSIVVAAVVILFPVLVQPTHHPRDLTIVNLKISALGLILYAADFDDTLPSASKWEDRLLANASEFEGGRRIVISENPPRRVAMNVFLSGKHVFSVDEPENTVLVLASGASQKNAYGGFEILSESKTSKKSAVGFLDGHVNAKKRTEFAKSIWVPKIIHSER